MSDERKWAEMGAMGLRWRGTARGVRTTCLICEANLGWRGRGHR